MPKMITDLELRLRKSALINEIFDAEEKQFGKLKVDLDDLRMQMDVDTATWGLVNYERDLKIEIDKNKPLSERRSVIKSKMRGAGKVDATLIKLVADSFTNGDVEVGFDGAIVIQFTSEIGIPPRLDDVKQAIEDTKPAHLNVVYLFSYLTVADVNAMTIAGMNNTLLNNFAGGV